MPSRPASLRSAPAPAADQSAACRLGVLAFGDSITNGGGELQWGVALQSWALWTARALGIPYSPYAVDGATVEDVIALQIPLYQRIVGSPDARYTLGCLYIGTNDVRLPSFDVARFEQLHGEALTFLERRCEQVLTLTIPLDMGRPRNRALVEAANAAIERSAAAAGAAVLDLRAFGGRGLVMADHVHPTALGQVAIAERALDLLETTGPPPRIRARALIDYETTWRGRLRGDATYAYRHIKQDLRILLRPARDG